MSKKKNKNKNYAVNNSVNEPASDLPLGEASNVAEANGDDLDFLKDPNRNVEISDTGGTEEAGLTDIQNNIENLEAHSLSDDTEKTEALDLQESVGRTEALNLSDELEHTEALDISENIGHTEALDLLDDLEHNIDSKLSDDLEQEEMLDISETKTITGKKAGKHKSDESFGKFVKEFIDHVINAVKNNKKPVIIGASFAVVLVLTTIICITIARNKGLAVSDNSISEAIASMDMVPQDGYEVNAYPAVNILINNYYLARQNNDIETLKKIQKDIDAIQAAKYEVLSNHIEQYSVRDCYTKVGPYPGSYIVFVTFDVKLSGFDVMAPGLQTFLLCPDDTGALYIYSGDFSEKEADYINQILAQNDVMELMKQIKNEYNDILASNEEFAVFMTSFKVQAKTELGEMIAAMEVAGNNSSGDDTSNNNGGNDDDNSSSENTAAVETFSVKTLKNVNIRKSDSENADKIATLSAGTVLLCTEEKANGWSEVIYNGEKGYIKSEYLARVDGEDGAVATNGTVMINETIKIRKEPSTESESLGVGYAGQTFERIETLDNGWTKILYNGQEAYIKTEFIVQ